MSQKAVQVSRLVADLAPISRWVRTWRLNASGKLARTSGIPLALCTGQVRAAGVRANTWRKGSMTARIAAASECKHVTTDYQ